MSSPTLLMEKYQEPTCGKRRCPMSYDVGWACVETLLAGAEDDVLLHTAQGEFSPLTPTLVSGPFDRVGVDEIQFLRSSNRKPVHCGFC